MERFTAPAAPTIEAIMLALQSYARLRDDDISEIGELLRLNGYQSGFQRSTKQVDAAYDVGSTDLYLNAVGGALGITLTLDPDPTDGQTHEIWKNDAGIGAVTIDGGSLNINGSGTLALALQYDAAVLVYMAAAGEWRARA